MEEKIVIALGRWGSMSVLGVLKDDVLDDCMQLIDMPNMMQGGLDPVLVGLKSSVYHFNSEGKRSQYQLPLTSLKDVDELEDIRNIYNTDMIDMIENMYMTMTNRRTVEEATAMIEERMAAKKEEEIIL